MPAKKKTANVDISDIRIECFMLCNFAQVESGKLNIIGGGWTEVIVPELPSPFAYFLAIKLAVPIARRELFARMSIRLIEEDKDEVIDDRPIEINADAPGDLDLGARSIAFASAVLMQLEISRPGRFHTQLWIADQMLTRSGFIVKSPNTQSVVADEENTSLE